MIARDRISLIALFGSILLFCARCAGPESSNSWQAKNDELIRKYNLVVRENDASPQTGVTPNLEEAKVTNVDGLDSVELYPGVNAKLFWGNGPLISVLHMAPGAKISEAQLPEERFIFVLEGSVSQLVRDSFVNMVGRKRETPDGIHSGTPRIDFVMSAKGSKNDITAGPDGARLLEVYGRVRYDYLQKSGVKDISAKDKTNDGGSASPNIEADKVYDLYDIQMTTIADGAHTRLISGKNVQLSFISMDPNSTFPHHIHPEEQMMFVLRGACNEILLDGEQPMKQHDVVRIPSNMVHGAKISDLGCDALDIFSPARKDYLAKATSADSAFHSIIPEGTRPELLIDGKKSKPELTFSEGPKWLNGKVYFSNMYFDQNFNASPAKSSIVELDPRGTYRNITEGKMQANGLYPYKNGNLLVCDMMGHRVVEMTTKGQVIRVMADKYDGKPIDGPNDVVTDAKGGFYFTDPQFTMEPQKNQPGRAVYYVAPDGKVTRVTEPNEFAMPNGIVLSPDGKNLYINNCYDDESWYPVKSEKDNFLWVYDVNPDGTISNGRKFAQLLLPDIVLDRKGRSSSADGMAIDKQGNLYVATYCGVQIFNAKGEPVGIINLPSFPVSLCFGDADMKTLYIVSYSKVYRVRTNMEGFVQKL